MQMEYPRITNCTIRKTPDMVSISLAGDAQRFASLLKIPSLQTAVTLSVFFRRNHQAP